MNRKRLVLKTISIILTVLTILNFGWLVYYANQDIDSERYALYLKWPEHLKHIVGLACCTFFVTVIIIGLVGIFITKKNDPNKKTFLFCTGILLLIFLANPLFVPSCRFREKTGRISCASNLKQIYLSLQQYAEDYAGFYPPENGAAGLEVLRKNDYLADYGIYICPCSFNPSKDKAGQPLTEDNVDYVYIGGLKSTSDPNLPLAYDKAKNHDGYYGNVLYANGTIEGIEGNPRTENIKK